mmetsp:Transcript_10326/g.12727  ORF Transcript_10326/g.12727 Transcript_10326/m.12727 type:complete len:271 (-) Transcript_10326:21-833(-)
MNGLSLADLQRRALPLLDRTLDRDEWRYRSAEGFIAEGEVLEEIMAKDKDSMALIGYDKESLASLIRNAMMEADKTVQDRYNLPFSITFQGQNIEVTKNWYMSPQYSFLYNEKLSDSEFNESWQCEYRFENQENGLEILIGGDKTRGVVHYVEWLGFCEGGHPGNLYRVDPFILVGTLEGKIYKETIQVEKERCEHQQNQKAAEIENTRALIEEVQAEILQLTDKDKDEHLQRDIEFLQTRSEKLKQELEQMKRNHATRLSKLEQKQIQL